MSGNANKSTVEKNNNGLNNPLFKGLIPRLFPYLKKKIELTTLSSTIKNNKVDISNSKLEELKLYLKTLAPPPTKKKIKKTQNPNVIEERPKDKISTNSATSGTENLNLPKTSKTNLNKFTTPAKTPVPSGDKTSTLIKKPAPKTVKPNTTKVVVDNNASNATSDTNKNIVSDTTTAVSDAVQSATKSASDVVENLGSQISNLKIPNISSDISSATSITPSPTKTEGSSSTFDFIKSIIPDSWINYIGSIPLIGGFLKSFFTKDEKKEISTQTPAQTETATNSSSDNGKSTKDLLDKEYAQMPENLKNITIEDSANQGKVVEQLAPLANYIETKYGINAKFAITQMIIESNWKGEKYKEHKFGVFNITKGSWTGATQKRMDGGENKEQEFRAYDNIAQAFIGYGIFMSSNDKYKGIVGKTAEDSIEAIANTPYAGDKNYKTKLGEVLKSVQNRWPKNIAQPTTTKSTTVEKTSSSSENLSHDTAWTLLKNEFNIHSSHGEVNATRKEGTTSLEEMKTKTAHGMLNFKKFLELKKITTGKLTITGGTEQGHDLTLKYTHWNGDKFDLRYQDNLVENYNWTSVGATKKQTGKFEYYELTYNGFTYQIHPESDHLDVGVVT